MLAVIGICYTVLVLFQYTFPLCWTDGRLPSRRWRWYVAAVALWCVPMVFTDIAHDALVPPSFAHGWWGRLAAATDAHLGTAQDWSPAPLIVVTSAVVVSRAAALPPARRRSTLLLLAVYLVWQGTLLAEYYFVLAGPANLAVSLLCGLVWPMALARLLTREPAWLPDRPTRRVITGYLLGLLVLAGYLAAATLLSLNLPAARAAGATALAGLAFMAGTGLRPLALWTSRCVERFYYGHRAEPYRLLRGLAAAAGRAPDPDRVPEALCRSIADALRLPGVALQARSRTGTRIQAEVGTFDHGSHALDLVYQGEIVGRMRVGLRAAERELAPQDREVLDSLADQVAAAITALRLYKDLQHSTERLVVAREEERRRLRRDIHDGLGPAALTNLGLADAVAELARRFSVGGLTVACVLEAYRPGSDLSAAVEAAAYRITAEALNNAARHAQARGAEVRLTADGTALVLDVRDDGVGLPDAVRGGVGLESVARRAAELGGTFQIMAADRGTHLRATLPIAHTP